MALTPQEDRRRWALEHAIRTHNYMGVSSATIVEAAADYEDYLCYGARSKTEASDK